MSSHPKVSDEEMKYFQFKAKQMFLLRKEDHEWNQFCKRNRCSCCLCDQTGNKSKEVGTQASTTNVPSGINRKLSVRTGVQNRNLPQTLNEIKTRLDKLDISLSQMQLPPQNKIIANQQLADIQVPISSSASGRNNLNDKRLEIIQNTLKGSLQRLHSTAAWKGNSSGKGQKKSSGFFIPHDLQEQRIIARRAYLASLAKLGNKKKTSEDLNSAPQRGKPNQRVDQKHNDKSIKTFSKSRKPSLQPKKAESIGSNITTAVQASEMKDEKIENAVDDIVNDLISETVLTVNKIRHLKSKKSVEHVGVREDKTRQEALHSEKCNKGIPETIKNVLHQTKQIFEVSQAEGEDDSHNHHKNHWEKIKGNLFNLKTAMSAENTTASSNPFTSENTRQNRNEQSPFLQTLLSQNTIPKTVKKHSFEFDKRTNLFIDSKSSKEIAKHRREFWKYLERISQTKKGNFDPWTLSNMVAESLLDDCILDVCQELQDIPTNLVTELYDQEFLQSL